ncbi:MAG: DoxX family protein [Acidimicrobiia bacterium]|nr:DoxX family protein [Acidimicrobiia bacterium]
MPELSILSLFQLVVALGLLNVWLLRSKSASEYRGGEAKTLKEEFDAYGLPDVAFYVVGALKIGAGIVLLAGLWLDLPVRLAAGVVGVLMVGALAMHLKVGDPAKRSVPAALMLLMSGAIVLLAQ